MSFSSTNVEYKATNAFSKIVTDYIDHAEALNDFYSFPPDLKGIKDAVEQRKNFPVNRQLLVTKLKEQYSSAETSAKLSANIDALLSENTFTICTAHQPNIFTGHLYFIYKILHAVKLSDELNAAFSSNRFVPVYYMGSEDADLDELGEVHIFGSAYKWNTDQKGAVGRMKIDKAFISLINEIESRIAVEPYGKEIMASVRNAYKEGLTIEKATFLFVHELFNELGLVIVLPDDADLKRSFSSVIKKELDEKFSEKAVNATAAAFPREYKVQAAGREINLFYLKDDIRERIEQDADGFKVVNTALHFTTAEIEQELEKNPERFSPNVILRPVFQELILPDVVFIGGGGELAYWLELKKVFEAANVFFPVLMLRNSFALVEKASAELFTKLGLEPTDIFRTDKELMDGIVKKNSSLQLDLANEKQSLIGVYTAIQKNASAIDQTLNRHTEALQTKALKYIDGLEKKMLRAEKRKFEAQQRQLAKLRSALNPGGSLQERHDNILQYFAVYGKEFIDVLYKYSLGIEQKFTIIKETDNG